jgi:hypothetical protein
MKQGFAREPGAGGEQSQLDVRSATGNLQIKKCLNMSEMDLLASSYIHIDLLPMMVQVRVKRQEVHGSMHIIARLSCYNDQDNDRLIDKSDTKLASVPVKVSIILRS